MKNTLRIIILLVIAATFGSCAKDAERLQQLDPGTNHLYFINSRVTMTYNFVPPFEDQYDIEAYSDGLFGSTYRFRFYDIPYDMLGRTIDLTEPSDLPLHFEFHGRLEWTASPEGVSGSFTEAGTHITTEYPDKSPFKSGKMYLEEDEIGITFVLRGILQNGKPIRMELFAPTDL